MRTEVWKLIIGYKFRYAISNLGQVKNINFRRKGRERLLKPNLTETGYYAVTLASGIQFKGKFLRKAFKVHRLVALNFIPNPNNFQQINHINGIKTDNNVVNLEWCDASHNIKHAYATGLIKNPSGLKTGEEHSSFKGNVNVFDSSGKLIDILKGAKDMESKGYSPSPVSNCLNGKRKTYKGCTFFRKKK